MNKFLLAAIVLGLWANAIIVIVRPLRAHAADEEYGGMLWNQLHSIDSHLDSINNHLNNIEGYSSDISDHTNH